MGWALSQRYIIFLAKSQKCSIYHVGIRFKKRNNVFFVLIRLEENVQAFTELEGLGMDQETLSEVEAIPEPIKNLTWPSGIDHK